MVAKLNSETHVQNMFFFSRVGRVCEKCQYDIDIVKVKKDMKKHRIACMLIPNMLNILWNAAKSYKQTNMTNMSESWNSAYTRNSITFLFNNFFGALLQLFKGFEINMKICLFIPSLIFRKDHICNFCKLWSRTRPNRKTYLVNAFQN